MVTISSFESKLEQIGKKLYQLRHLKNEKLDTVSHAIGISKSVISQVEHGRYKPISLQLLIKLTDYYNKPIDELLSSVE